MQLRGVRPFLSDKYDITQHPNYKLTADADPKNAFDIEGYLKARLKLKPCLLYTSLVMMSSGVSCSMLRSLTKKHSQLSKNTLRTLRAHFYTLYRE